MTLRLCIRSECIAAPVPRRCSCTRTNGRATRSCAQRIFARRVLLYVLLFSPSSIRLLPNFCAHTTPFSPSFQPIRPCDYSPLSCFILMADNLLLFIPYPLFFIPYISRYLVGRQSRSEYLEWHNAISRTGSLYRLCARSVSFFPIGSRIAPRLRWLPLPLCHPVYIRIYVCMYLSRVSTIVTTTHSP